MDILKEQVIELSNGKKYFVISQTNYNGKDYLLTNEIIDEELPGTVNAILRAEPSDDNIKFTVERDEDILKYLLDHFSKSI